MNELTAQQEDYLIGSGMERYGEWKEKVKKEYGMDEDEEAYFDTAWKVVQNVVNESGEGSKEPLVIIDNGKKYCQDEKFRVLRNSEGDEISLDGVEDRFDNVGIFRAVNEYEKRLDREKEEESAGGNWNTEWILKIQDGRRRKREVEELAKKVLKEQEERIP